MVITNRKRAVIYCRVSTDKQEQDGESLEYQEDKCRRYAELHDIDIVVVLHEAKSGYIHYTLREKLTFARQLIRYVVNKEEALTRLSVFTMFVDQDISIRAIAHKLTEDGILPPAKARGWNVKSDAWQPSTVHKILVGPENIGTIVICKTKVVMTH